jgi:hypothetical protein
MLAFIKLGKPFGWTIAGTLSFISFLLKIATFYCYYGCLSYVFFFHFVDVCAIEF